MTCFWLLYQKVKWKYTKTFRKATASSLQSLRQSKRKLFNAKSATKNQNLNLIVVTCEIPYIKLWDELENSKKLEIILTRFQLFVTFQTYFQIFRFSSFVTWNAKSTIFSLSPIFHHRVKNEHLKMFNYFMMTEGRQVRPLCDIDGKPIFR